MRTARVSTLRPQRLFALAGGLAVSVWMALCATGCSSETPADAFMHFVQACTAHDADVAFGRLSPDTQQLVTLSSARHAAQHPERRMAPAQYMFADESIDRLAQGFTSVNEVARLTVQDTTWAVLHVVNVKGDIAQVFMVRTDGRWLLHTVMPPQEVLDASRLALPKESR